MSSLYKRATIIILVAIFLGAGAYLPLIALGFVPDIRNLRIEKTGGLYIEYAPAGAALYINGEIYPAKNFITGSIIRSLLINEVVPGEYRLTLRKNGFRPWEKSLSVEPGKMTVANDITLLPESPPTDLAAREAKNFWLAAREIIRQDKNKKILVENFALRGTSLELSSPASNLVVTKDLLNRFLINLEMPAGSINLDELFQSLKERELGLGEKEPIERVLYHPFSKQKIIISTGNSLYILDAKKIILEKLAAVSSTKSIALSDNEVFIFSNDGSLTIVNLLLKTSGYFALGAPSPLSRSQATRSGEKIIILAKNGGLLFYDRKSDELRTIAEEVSSFSLSPEEARLFIIKNNGEADIFYVGNYRNSDGSLAAQGTMRAYLSPTPKPIQSAAWIADEPNYILVGDGADIYISELDTRPPINAYLIATSTREYLIERNSLYLLKNSGELLILKKFP